MGLTDEERAFAQSFRSLLDDEEKRSAARNALYDDLCARGQINRYVLHRHLCRRSCKLAVTFRYSGLVLCAVRDYKYSPGLNAQRSVASARERNTLDGDRHWPGHVYDVEQLAPIGGMTVACRHVTTTMNAGQLLELVDGVRPGFPGRPTIIEKSSQ